MNAPTGTPPSVLLRDLFVFHVKLVLDGMKDVALIWLTGLAVAADLIVGGPTRGRRFYAVLRWSERVDLWLNLHGPARNAEQNPDGIFGESRDGDATYVGRMETLMAGRGAAHAAPPAPRG